MALILKTEVIPLPPPQAVAPKSEPVKAEAPKPEPKIIPPPKWVGELVFWDLQTPALKEPQLKKEIEKAFKKKNARLKVSITWLEKQPAKKKAA